MDELFFKHEDTTESLEGEVGSFPQHPCFKYKGKGESCNECDVKKRGLCEEMMQILTYPKMLSGLDKEGINTIISETIAGTIKNVNNYRGEPGKQFAAYVRRILRNKKADYFRVPYQKTSNFNLKDIKDLPSLIEQIKTKNSETIEYIYEEWLSEETKNLIDNNLNIEGRRLKELILKDFNRILENKDNTGKNREFYDSNKMNDLEIPPEILDLTTKEKKSIEERRKGNKALLEIIFPSLGSTSAGKIIELSLEGYENELKITPEFENKIYVEQLLSRIKEIDIDCKNLFSKLYEGFKEGKIQKDIAEELGLKENTFNQRLKRCRDQVMNLLKKEGNVI
jgi:RNA polymerase sigma factor (sigma-70 family)